MGLITIRLNLVNLSPSKIKGDEGPFPDFQNAPFNIPTFSYF